MQSADSPAEGIHLDEHDKQQTDTSHDARDQDIAGQEKSLSTQVGAGFSWLLLAAAGSKVFGVIQIIGLGFLLNEEDYGLFGLAIGVFGFTHALRDGGMRWLLVQRGKEIDALLGPGYWLSLASNMLAAILVLGGGYVYATAIGEPQVFGLIAVLCGSLLLTPAATVAGAVLSIDMRFKEQAWVGFWQTGFRCATLLICAAIGLGAYSFPAGMVVGSLFASIALIYVTKLTPWMRSPKFGMWGELIKPVIWLIAGAGALTLQRQGDYFTAGFFVDAAVIGLYYFAYQFLDTIQQLIGQTVERIMVPSFVKLIDEPKRLRQAYRRAVNASVLVTVGATVCMALVADGLVRLIWGNKWVDAVTAVQILGVFFFTKVLFSLPSSLLNAKGLFRDNALVCALLGFGAVLAAGIGAYYVGTAAGIALSVGIALTLTAVPVTAWLLGDTFAERLKAGWEILFPWVIAIAIALPLDFYVGDGNHWPDGRLGAALEFIILGVCFGVLFGLASCTFFRQTVNDFGSLLPARIRTKLPAWLRGD